MEYHVKPPGKQCALTGDALVPGSKCFSTLIEKNGELVRLDFSERGWAGPPSGTMAYWQCTIPGEIKQQGILPDPETLFRFFEQMTEDANPTHDKLRFVLALVLLQKKRMKLEGMRTDEEHEGETLDVIGSRGEGPYSVRNFHLTNEEIGALQQELSGELMTNWSLATDGRN